MSPAAATATAVLSNVPSRNPFEIARSHLIARLVQMSVPPAHAIAEAGDHIKDAANLFDEWLAAVGGAVADRVNVDVDYRVFQGAFLGAVDGNATYEVECVIARASQYRTLRRV